MRVLFSAAEIAARVEAMAGEIARAMPAEFVLVGVLKGAAFFLADLARALHRAGAKPAIEFMRLSSYGAGMASSGEVRLLGGMPEGIAGRLVLLVDDIADTGHSLAFAADLLRRRGAGEVRLCAFLDKPARRQAAVELDFVGFAIPDVFVAGYGADHAENYRSLPYIVAVE